MTSPSTQQDLTKLTVNVTPRSMAALNDVARRTGYSRTDTVNRALQLNLLLLDLAEISAGTTMEVRGLLGDEQIHRVIVRQGRRTWLQRLFGRERRPEVTGG